MKRQFTRAQILKALTPLPKPDAHWDHSSRVYMNGQRAYRQAVMRRPGRMK